MRVLLMIVGQVIGFTWLGHELGGDIPWSVWFPVAFLQLVGLFYGMTGGRK